MPVLLWESKRRVKLLENINKLTAGLLVFLFLISPCQFILAQDEDPAGQVNLNNELSDSEIIDNDTEPENPVNTKQEDINQVESETESQTLVDDPKFPADNNLKKKPAAPDEVSGALIYDYQFNLPPGRNGLQPDLKLIYNSQARDLASIIGQGWLITVPYVERLNKKGIEKIYTDPIFYSSLSDELKLVGGNNYFAKVDNGEFLKYFYNNDTWIAFDKQGVKYTFGQTATARQDDPDNITRVYRWMLEEVRDTNDNFIRYEYFKDQGQIYPSKIFYSGNNTTDGIFEVEFLRESRNDQMVSHKTGFNVKTNYRFNSILIKVNNSWVKKYDLNYIAGDNNKTSLLVSVTETGKDENNNIVSLPPTSFQYQTSGTVHWETNTTTWSSSESIGEQTGGLVADINGDGLDDLIKSFHSAGSEGKTEEIIRKVYLNNGQGQFIENQNYEPPFDFMFASGSQFVDYGARLLDVNGDGLLDLLNSGHQAVARAYLNTGNGWQQANQWLPPTMFTYWDGDISSNIANLNGDNLPDILGTRWEWINLQDVLVTYAYLNTGNGWVRDLNWQAPNNLDIRFSNGTLMADVNADGLDDIIQSIKLSSGNIVNKVFLNNGQGTWVESSSFFPPTYFFQKDYYGNITDRGYRMFDANGDGLVDILKQGLGAYINNGNNWSVNNDLNWNQPFELGGVWESHLYTAYISNINGDSMVDIFRNKAISNNIETTVVENISPKANLLKKIIYDSGGSTDITYQSTPLYRNGVNLLNPNLSMVIDTVASITTNDGLGNSSIINYSYEGGSYYFDQNNIYEAKFAGFSKVAKTDNLTKVVSFYHQGNVSNSGQGEYQDHVSKIGKIYRQEIYDLSNNLFSKIINKWDKIDLGNDRNFVKLIRTTEVIYDGNSSHKDKTETYDYDNTNGNKINVIEWGEVSASDNGDFTDIGNDKFSTTINYAVGSTNNVIGLVSSDLTLDQASNKVKEAKYYYDNLPWGQISFGNQTKQEQWVSGTNYVNTQKVYNQFGLVVQDIDQLGRPTNYVYDAYNLYPVEVINPLGQINSFVYDYSSGKVVITVDPNGAILQTNYDGLDRPVVELQPDQTIPSLMVVKTIYEYTDVPNAFRLKQSNYLDDGNIVDNYIYYDGLGRKIQERNEAEDNNQFNVRDFIYTQNDLLLKESLPYVSVGSARTTATTTTNLYTVYNYDAMKRVINAQTAVGTITNNYNDWQTTVTDAEGKVKDLYKDAYDNLVQVNEHNNLATYSTYYQWNYLKKLTKITDALGNVRNFIYDGLGRNLLAEDLHAVGDTTFGVWQYSYDEVGNLIYKIAPNTKATAFTYDNLNRVLTEDAIGTEEIEVVYDYDNCQNGVGRLCSVINSAIKNFLSYNILGQLIQEDKRIGRAQYITNYTYDRQGNEILIINPDNSRVVYNYNSAGLINSVQRQEASDPGLINVINNIDYNAVNLPTVLAYANGVVTTNTYDANELYRLRTKITIAGSQNLQHLTYTYDAVGNITQIIDASDTLTAKTTDYTYDDLHRLISATITNSAAQGVDGPNNENQIQTFSYDAIGNLTYKSDVGNYSYDGYQGENYANPHAVTSAGTKNYYYDENGNLIQVMDNVSDESTTMMWDYGNRLMTVIVGEKVYAYTYDSNGQRVKEESGDNKTYYPTKNYSLGSNGAEKHIFLGDTAIATISGTEDSAISYNIHSDHLTGSNVITDSNQVIDELTDYYSFGTMRIDEQNGEHNEKRKFTGHEYDVDTGLIYANARYYNASLGRWLSQDNVFKEIANPQAIEQLTQKSYIQFLSEPQEHNSYSYVRNNPLKYKDYDGNAFFVPFLIYIGIEALSSAFDLFNIYKVDSNLNSTQAEKYDARATALLGTMAPGPGNAYTKGSAKIDQIASKINWGKIWSKGEFKTGFTNLMRHAVDHAQKLGFKNADEYLGGARSFVAEAIEKGYSATIRAADNTIRIFDQSTRRFASYELSDGKLVPKTFMKTDSVGYWTSQMRNYGGQVLYDLKELIK